MTVLLLFSHFMGFVLHLKHDSLQNNVNKCGTLGSVYMHAKICIYFPVLFYTLNLYQESKSQEKNYGPLTKKVNSNLRY